MNPYGLNLNPTASFHSIKQPIQLQTGPSCPRSVMSYVRGACYNYGCWDYFCCTSRAPQMPPSFGRGRGNLLVKSLSQVFLMESSF